MDLLDVIRAGNPWMEQPDRLSEWARPPEGYVPRIVRWTTDWPVAGKAHLLVGARQVGKSTWLRARLGTSVAPLLLNCEELAIRSWARSASLVAADLRRLTLPTTPVLFEEAQHLDDAGLLVKGLVDAKLPNPLYITGSSAWHLHARTRESLAGRAVRAFMHPLSLAELAPVGLPPLLAEARLRELAETAAILGGYPEVVTRPAPERTLRGLLEAFVIRDASDLFRIKHLDAFRRLLLLIAGQVGSLVNTSEWAALCGISRDTVENYVDLLVESQVLQRVTPFAGGKRAEVTHHPKVYFCDNGLLNAITGRFEPFAGRTDRGALFENLVAAELRKHLDPLHPGGTLRYWRSTSKAEVDFVIDDAAQGGPIGIECKAAALTRPELTRSARSFIQAYQPARFVVVNLSLTHDAVIEGVPVAWRPAAWLAAPWAMAAPVSSASE
ncbi:ATP-binding protein [Myxococcota bacterium]|nr:ATP-binding protein [Myxococcota bacterium]